VPDCNKEVCTYINASFIEVRSTTETASLSLLKLFTVNFQGYDNLEQFIITQDPLEHTVTDFWRMVVEQNIRSIVMLSEVGEDACPRYWPEKDQETSHDFIRVKYMQSQSFPFYYRREFTITNSRTNDASLVTQFQYNGWPVGIDQVPESARGLVELIDTTFKHKESLEKTGPTIVHCR
jgi:protein-tyrosine phosphatase